MILVDTSIWVEVSHPHKPVVFTEEESRQFVTCGPIMQELLQGLRPDMTRLRAALLQLPRIADPVPCDLFVAAADLYRAARDRGYTIRSSNDCLIAAIALEHNVPVWHRDRDFRTIARYTSLRTIEALPRRRS